MFVIRPSDSLKNMLKIRNLCKITHTFICTGRYSVYTHHRYVKIMKQLTRNEDPKSKWYLQPANTIPLQRKQRGKTCRITTGTKKRAKYISEELLSEVYRIMINGDLDPRVKVQVSKVTLLPDFSCIKVYWQPSFTDDHNLIEAILERKTVDMQNLLKELRMVGLTEVPHVRFKKDLSWLNYEQVVNLLSKEDLGPPEEVKDQDGEDYREPPIVKVKPGLKEIAQQFRMENLDKGGDMDSSRSSKYDTEFSELTERFRQDLYGLKHANLALELRLQGSQSRKTSHFDYTETEFQPNRSLSKEDRKTTRDMYAKHLKILNRNSSRKIRRNEHMLLDWKNMDSEIDSDDDHNTYNTNEPGGYYEEDDLDVETEDEYITDSDSDSS